MRFGGHPSADGHRFELSGGALCLDLANTLDCRPTAPRELLGEYGDLLAWAMQAGVLTEAQGGRLRSRARGEPRAALAALRRVRVLREALFAIFSAVAHTRPPPPQAVHQLNGVLRRAAATRELRASRAGLAWGWSEGRDAHFDAVLLRVACSTADLLTSPVLSRVRECEGEGCAWLFLDASRNRTRRWCDMTVCGNRAKARRFRRARARA